MRLFVSIRPSRQAVSHLEAAFAGRRTSRPDQWHITLAFLGEVAGAAMLAGPLRAAAVIQPPFTLHLAGGGAFTGARAVWAGVDGDLDALSRMANAVRRACSAVGVALEPRRFRPHLTVGKTNRLDPALLDAYEGPGWQVDEIELVQSVLGRTATHTVQERFPLYQA